MRRSLGTNAGPIAPRSLGIQVAATTPCTRRTLPFYSTGGGPRPGILANSLRIMHMTTTSAVHSDPDILGGTPVFVGTRVPVQNLIDYLEHGRDLDAFLDDFPTVGRPQAIAALEEAKQLLLAGVRPAR